MRLWVEYEGRRDRRSGRTTVDAESSNNTLVTTIVVYLTTALSRRTTYGRVTLDRAHISVINVRAFIDSIARPREPYMFVSAD